MGLAPNARTLVHMPDVSSDMSLKYLAERRKLAQAGGFVGVPLGIQSLDSVMLPLLPGQICTVLARPGNGKTSFLIRWARWWAQVIKQNPNTYKGQYVALITTEQIVEELNAFMAAAATEINIENMARGKLTDKEWAKLERWSVESSQLPLVIIGQSSERRRARVPLRMDVVSQALQSIEDDFGMKPSFILLDWLQQMKAPKDVPYQSDSKALAVAENLSICKDIAIMNGCPMAIAAQAARKVDSYDVQIPQADDGQWTSSLEQDSDTQVSLVRPIKYRQDGEMFGDLKVKGDLQLVVTVIKQKMGPANIARIVSMDPRYNKINDLEERLIDLKQDYDLPVMQEAF